MTTLTVLLLDDDSPEAVTGFDGVTFVTAQTCSQAEDLLDSGRVAPDWVVVDIVVPKGGWNPAAVVLLPGLAYIRHLKETHGDRFGILAFSIAMTPAIREMALRAGAVGAYGKSFTSLGDLVERMRTGRFGS
jgi:DNA-binding NarL/FixJ family response regulator